MDDALVSQVAIEAIAVPVEDVRVTQFIAELVTVDNANSRISQFVAEILGIDSSNSKVTQVVMELIGPSMAPNQPIVNLTDTFETTDNLTTSFNRRANLTDTFETTDSLTTIFGTPINELNCPQPLLCINPGPITVLNPSLPNFPLSGNTIAYNMSIAPLSLVVNNVTNDDFAAGLYVFYEKNNSVWYKFKTLTSGWSNEEYLVTCGNNVGISDSRTIFDCAGYPITAYRNLNGQIGIHYYLDTVGVDNTTLFTGTSPNVIICNDQIIVMFIPSSYNNSLTFVTSADCYAKECFYSVNISNLTSFSLRQSTDTDWTFSLVSVNSGTSSIYYAEVHDIVFPTPSNLFQCPVFPSLTNVQLINNGIQSYTDNLIGYDFIVYRGILALNDVSGYSSPSSTLNSFTWNPSLSGHLSYAIRQDNTQDIQWPALNVFNNKLCIAWLETHETGILHLNYAEAPATKTSILADMPGTNQIYIYPFIANTITGTYTENIPFDSLKVVDFAGSIFNVNTYPGTHGLGYNVETPGAVQSVRFLQTFRQQSQIIIIKLTTAPQMTQEQGLIAPQPLSFYPITIYNGNSNMVFTKLTTALDGTVSCVLPKGIYLFEIQTLNDSILWSQTLV